MKKEKALKITAIVWIMVSLTILANATTISDTITSFTGTVSVTPTDNSNALTVTNAGTGNGIFIDQNGNGVGLNIDSESTSQSAIYANIGSNKAQMALGKPTDAVSTYWFYRNDVLANTASPVMFIEQDEAGDDQNTLNIQQDGTGNGLFIDQNGNGNALVIDSEATQGKYAILAQLPNENFAFGIVAENSVNMNSTMVLGGYYIWVDGTGDLRIKSSAPTSDTDGTVIGAQS